MEGVIVVDGYGECSLNRSKCNRFLLHEFFEGMHFAITEKLAAAAELDASKFHTDH
jgi:hypothetical protein